MSNHCYFKADNKILVIMPYTPTSVVSDQLWPTHSSSILQKIQPSKEPIKELNAKMLDKISDLDQVMIYPSDAELPANEFTQLCYLTREFRLWVQHWVQQGGILVAQLLPQINIRRTHHTEWQVSNYDWLWENLDIRLSTITLKEPIGNIKVTEFGNDSPWREYLTQAQLRVTMFLEGCQEILATYGQHAIAGVIRYGLGKIILVPCCHPQKDQVLWDDSLLRTANHETWHKVETLSSITPSWLECSAPPNLEPLKTSCQNYQQQILQLQQQCEQLQQKCLQVQKQLEQQILFKEKLFCGGTIELLQGLVQWFQHHHEQASIQMTDDCLRYSFSPQPFVLMPVVSEQSIPLWWGRRLLRMLHPGDKGVIIANANRNIEPSLRKDNFSPDLIQFAQKEGIALISLPELLTASEQHTFAVFLEKLQQAKGIVNF